MATKRELTPEEVIAEERLNQIIGCGCMTIICIVAIGGVGWLLYSLGQPSAPADVTPPPAVSAPAEAGTVPAEPAQVDPTPIDPVVAE